MRKSRSRQVYRADGDPGRLPTDVVRSQVLYYDADGKAIASSASEVVSLEDGKKTEIAMTEINPLVKSDVTLKVTNAYATGLESLAKVNYTISYNSSFGNDLQDTGETAFTVTATKVGSVSVTIPTSSRAHTIETIILLIGWSHALLVLEMWD